MSDISDINDRFRKSLGSAAFNGGIPGQVFTTAGIAALPAADGTAIRGKVQAYDDFNGEDGEHDFGAFDQGGQRIFWKIDYYSGPDMSSGSENPADLSKTFRVLTILLASEW